MISKYPPIEGGVSSLAFWLAKALGKRGHEVHIVTNAWCVEPEFMEEFDVEDIDQYQPKNVKVHNIDPLARLEQIPSSKNYVERIASLAIDVVKEYSIDVIDSWYMIPYGISGFITKIITKKPQILRHAGSDIDILLSNNSRAYRSLLVELLKNVDKIVTRPHMKEVFLSLGVGEDKMFFSKECIDVNEFTPYAKPLKLANYTNREINNPVITYVGKCAKNRGLIELLAAASKVKAELTLLFVTSGEYSKEFRNLIKSFKMEKKVIIINFIPPWRMPSLIKASSCLVFPETEFPATFRTPIVPREAWAVG
jgi:glycosyltransferase involved in cell wall biosynthesis